MKRLYHLLFRIIICVVTPVVGNAQLTTPTLNTTILNKNIDQTINTTLVTTDPLREGAFFVVNDGNNTTVQNIINSNTTGQITSFSQAKTSTISIINTLINYSLSLLAFIALVYLMYHWFIMLTAAGNEEKYSEGLQWIKYAAIALAGIGLSWLVISLIFYIISFIV